MKKGQKLWTRDELILAINLYCKTPFGQIHRNNPEIIKLAHLIGRTNNSVAYKLVNFASLDPTLKARGIKGAENASKLDKKIWNEFFNNWDDLPFQSENLRAKFENTSIEKLNDLELEYSFKDGETKDQLVKTRVNQNFFRKMILASYNNKCCITGIGLTDLLVAGHIRPWGKDEINRLNPQNGLLLNSLHDKAFENGWISIDQDYTIHISPKMNHFLPNEMLQQNFLKFAEKKIILPTKFLPNKEFLTEHFHERFKK